MSRGMRMLAALAAALLLIAVGAPGVATGGELTCDGEAPAAAPASAQAGETDGDCLYTLLDAGGRQLTQRAGRIYEGDEYIAADDGWYRVRSVDDGAQTAVAEYLGKAGDDVEAFGALAAARGDGADGADGGKKLIAMYSTHSEESYLRGDGAASKWEGAGIYDVGESLKAALEKRGIDVVYSHDTFLPHDAGAYGRSRRTAEELLKQGPDALLDIHRDAVPAEQYETEVDGEDISKVRLFVGRNNQNAAENRAFARQIKAEADKRYPGLIKDIFIGKGNYNQELSPNALLLEFGTHRIEKEKAQEATGYIAEVLDSVLYGGGAKAEEGRAARGAAAAKGAGWAIGLAVLAAALYALLSTGSLKGAWGKLGRRASELTGGLLGNKKR